VQPLELDADTATQPSTRGAAAADDTAPGALAATRALEAPPRTRNDATRAPGRDFTPALAAAVAAASAAKAVAARAGGGRAGARPRAAVAAPIAAVPSRRTDRGKGGAVLEDMGLAEYGGLGISVPAPAAAAATPAPRAAPPRAAPAPRRAAKPAPKPKPKPPSSGLPIIIVPSAATARLNMYNAVAFLERGVFTPPDACMAAAAPKPPTALISRTLALPDGAPPKRYLVTDDASKFGKDEWRRVAAVVVGGAAWQFKGWPFKGAPDGDTVSLFSAARGLYLHYGDDAPPAAVKAWNVARFALHRGERHRDRSVAAALWKAVDEFLAARGR
jgi:parafibromin